jgi:starch phosphorylase
MDRRLKFIRKGELMKPVRTFRVIPKLPENIEKLRTIAYNLCWCWDYEAVSLIRRMDHDLWEDLDHNPIRVLGAISQTQLDDLSKDDGFLAHYRRVIEKFERYMNEPAWYDKHFGKKDAVIAYFSAEFGITESLPIYSGGLGILAGDHLKSASDLGLPLIGVGLLYQNGYFRQHLNYDGWQAENYPINDFYNMAVEEVKDQKGNSVIVTIDFPGRKVYAKIWVAHVGRVRLFLLDTNIPLNTGADHDITDELYGGDNEKRLHQEMVLGIGGIRMLRQLGITPSVCHMNEGHSAFLGLERTRLLMQEQQLSFREALEVVRAGSVFTTHTPVPAGIDVFPSDLIKHYFFDYAKTLHISWDDFLSLGSDSYENRHHGFSMAVLAFHLSERSNGVSKLHGHVSRNIFKYVWPELPENEVPVTSITNGIHHLSWISHDMESLYHRYMGDRWLNSPQNIDKRSDFDEVPDEELWRTHERRRERLVSFARKRLKTQLIRRGAPHTEVKSAEEVLDPEILTIGFARRFATYKRADLILRHPQRLARIMNNDNTPVQIIFSGKAHPKDTPGKELIRELVHLSQQEDFRKRIVFIEDYDMAVARYLVQGVDVWLNTPRRLYEASGTSGMKAAVNGALNMSILDGWWDEAFKPGIGWAIGKADEYSDINYQYDIEANAIYDLLEKEVIPLFYSRGSDKLPRGWLRYMKDSISTLYPVFNTHRMVTEYTEQCYNKAESRFILLSQNTCQNAKALSAFKDGLAGRWTKIKIEDIRSEVEDKVLIGHCLTVLATVNLGDISPDHVDVQVYHGLVDSGCMIVEGVVDSLLDIRHLSDGKYEFSGCIKCTLSGMQGFSVRILPKHELLENPFIPGLIKWAGQ